VQIAIATIQLTIERLLPLFGFKGDAFQRALMVAPMLLQEVLVDVEQALGDGDSRLV
jgi:hypothetical protein